MDEARVIARTPAGPTAEVRTLGSGRYSYRRRPCEPTATMPGCPWRTDQVGHWPAEAFRVSAHVAYDLDGHRFACHKSPEGRPYTCAGFLLRGAAHNLAVRLDVVFGDYDPRTVDDGGHELHADYRAMAAANGVDPDDPILEGCR